MSLPLRHFTLAPVLVLVLGAYACSSTPPSGEAGNPGGDAASASGADKVGSVPEDMLSTEAAGGDAAAAQADPFGDLKEDESAKKAPEAKTPKAAAALAVPEEETTSHNSAGTGQMDTYSVKAGDTLMKVAFSLYGDVDRWKDLQDWNTEALKKGNSLRKGMKLRYEVPAEAFQQTQLEHSYEIKKGDTLALIADEVYGRKMKYKKLQKYNAQLIKNPNRIFAGFTIFYDITAKEMAEAEARRNERMASGGAPAPGAMPPPPPANNFANSVDSALPPPPVPSAINPPPARPLAQPKSAAVAPSASDNSVIGGPGPSPMAMPPPAPPKPGSSIEALRDTS